MDILLNQGEDLRHAGEPFRTACLLNRQGIVPDTYNSWVGYYLLFGKMSALNEQGGYLSRLRVDNKTTDMTDFLAFLQGDHR